MSTLYNTLLLWLLIANEPLQSPRFTITTAAETRSDCSLLSLADGTLHIEQARTRLTLTSLVELHQEKQPLPPFLTRDFIMLSNGDRLPLDPEAAASLSEGRLTVWPATSLPSLHGKGLSLYLPHVVMLFWTLPDGVDNADLFFAKLQHESRKRDVLYLRNGDRIEGSVTTLTGKAGCVMTTDRKQVTTPWSQVSGIAWNTERLARLRTKKTYSRVVLQGGARLNLLDLRLDEKTQRWQGTTQFGPGLELPLASVLAVDVRQGSAVDLADLAPLRYEHQPYLGVSWPLVHDAAVTGHPLQLRGTTYEKGLGLHAPCKVTYSLDRNYQRFEALVGLDDLHARLGRARLALLLDGKRIDLAEGKEITSRDAPTLVRADVRGVKELTLVVETGSFGDVQAHLNWVNPRLIKSEPGK